MEVLAGGMRLTATTSNKSRAVLLICQRHGSTALHQGSSTLDNPLLWNICFLFILFLFLSQSVCFKRKLLSCNMKKKHGLPIGRWGLWGLGSSLPCYSIWTIKVSASLLHKSDGVSCWHIWDQMSHIPSDFPFLAAVCLEASLPWASGGRNTEKSEFTRNKSPKHPFHHKKPHDCTSTPFSISFSSIWPFACLARPCLHPTSARQRKWTYSIWICQMKTTSAEVNFMLDVSWKRRSYLQCNTLHAKIHESPPRWAQFNPKERWSRSPLRKQTKI